MRGWTRPRDSRDRDQELLEFLQRLFRGPADPSDEITRKLMGDRADEPPHSALELLTLFDVTEDLGIGAQRQLRGIDEGWGQGGIADAMWKMLGEFFQGESRTYQSPYSPAGGQEREERGLGPPGLEMQDIEPASLGERVASGLLQYGSGGVDLVQGVAGGIRALGRGVARGADDMLDLAISGAARSMNAPAATAPARAASRGFRTLKPDEVGRYLDAVATLPAERRAFLTPHTAESLREKIAAGGSIRMTDDGVGYILDASGDLQGLINTSGRSGAGRAGIEDALERGARTLDAYDGFLTDLYSGYGFRETGRAAWDPQYASPAWNVERYGTPDVVFMAREGMPAAADVERVARVISQLPDEHQGLARALAAVVDSNNLGMPPSRLPLATRKMVNRYDDAGNVIGRASQAELQQDWLRRTLANLSDENLDAWESAIRRGLEIEDARRVLDLGDGTQTLLRHWYDTEPVLSRFTRALGDSDGKAAYAGLMSLIAATSPRTQVRANTEIGLALAHHIARGRRLRDIAAMSADEFSGAIIRGGGFRGSDVTVTPAMALRHAEFKGGAAGAVPRRATDELQGSLGQVLQGQRMEGQKVSSFLPSSVDPVLGGNWTFITIDSHNLRQTLHLSGVPIDTGAQRLALARAWGIEDLSKLKPYFSDVVVPAGKKRALAPNRVTTAFVDELYASAVTRTGLYSILEDFQRGVMRSLAARSPDLNMAEALFQARLWTGANQASVVADTVPLAQAIFDSLRAWGVRRMGGETNLDTIIRHVWGADDGSAVLLEAVRQAGNYAQLGIHSTRDFRHFLARGAAKATPRHKDEDILGLLGLGGR